MVRSCTSVDLLWSRPRSWPYLCTSTFFGWANYILFLLVSIRPCRRHLKRRGLSGLQSPFVCLFIDHAGKCQNSSSCSAQAGLVFNGWICQKDLVWFFFHWVMPHEDPLPANWSFSEMVKDTISRKTVVPWLLQSCVVSLAGGADSQGWRWWKLWGSVSLT